MRRLARPRAVNRNALKLEPLESRALLSASLLRDINQDTVGSDPAGSVDVNGTLFFVADDGAHGRELWKSDGSAAGTLLVRDIHSGLSPTAGPASSGPTLLTNVNGLLYFYADDGIHGYELWRSDGTEQGTFLVKDVRPGPDSSMPAPPNVLPTAAAAADAFYFVADDGEHGVELWRSDGTETGTAMVKDLAPGSASLSVFSMLALNGKLYFSAGAGASVSELRLWTTDGTDAGTIRLSEAAVHPNQLAVHAGNLYFSATTPQAGYELWKSDGTPEGTALVADLRGGPASSSPQSLTAVGDTLYFTANTGGGYELWKTDGAAQGALPVLNLPTIPGFIGISSLAAFNGMLYFSHVGAQTRNPELWRTNGQPGGSERVAAIQAGDPGSGSYQCLCHLGGMVAAGDHLIFTAFTDAYGEELWASDGTAQGTTLLRDIRPGGQPSAVASLVASGGVAYFTATDDGAGAAPDAVAVGRELWRTDGTPAGTRLVRDLNAATRDAVPPVTPGDTHVATIGDKLVFVANDPDTGRELWITDGSETRLLKDLQLGPGSLSPAPQELLTVGDSLLFSAGRKLWITDGTEAGTIMLAPALTLTSSIRSPVRPVVVNGILYFAADDGSHGVELWSTDGTAEGTQMVSDLAPGPASTPLAHLIDFDGTLYFTTAQLGGGYSLWRSDGTAAGTSTVVTGLNYHGPLPFIAAGGALYFTARDAQGVELWATDGTQAGTRMVKDIGPGAADAGISVMFAALDRLFFSADDGQHGPELWVSDGTEIGTQMLADIASNPAAPAPGELAEMGGRVYFRADGSLWRTDGTGAGTEVVSPGIDPITVKAFGGRLYFSALSEAGRELWSSDGTSAGTAPVADVRAGALSSSPQPLEAAGGRIYFRADDGLHGSEMWVLAPPAVLTDDELRVVGTAGADEIRVLRSDGRISVSDASSTLAFDEQSVRSVRIIASDGADALLLDGLDDLTIELGAASSGDRLEVRRTKLDFNATVDTSPLRLSVGDGGIIAFRGSHRLTGLSMNGGHVVLDGNEAVLTLDSVAITGPALLDLTGNRLVIETGDEERRSLLERVEDLIVSARDGGTAGKWTGPGIGSSFAAGNPITGLALNDGGQRLIVQYTYNGDANLDGTVNADDYWRIDEGFSAAKCMLDCGTYIGYAGGYAWGDFNYDELINADDYFLIDSAFLGQGAPMGGAAPAASSAVTSGAAGPGQPAAHKKLRKRAARSHLADELVRPRRAGEAV